MTDQTRTTSQRDTNIARIARSQAEAILAMANVANGYRLSPERFDAELEALTASVTQALYRTDQRWFADQQMAAHARLDALLPRAVAAERASRDLHRSGV